MRCGFRGVEKNGHSAEDSQEQRSCEHRIETVELSFFNDARDRVDHRSETENKRHDEDRFAAVGKRQDDPKGAHRAARSGKDRPDHAWYSVAAGLMHSHRFEQHHGDDHSDKEIRDSDTAERSQSRPTHLGLSDVQEWTIGAPTQNG